MPVKLLMALATLTLLAACQSRPAKQYYLLQGPTPTANVEIQHTVGIGPIELAEFLNRPQVAVQQADGSLLFNGTHVWAEPLPDGIARLLNLHLSQAIPGMAGVYFPWRADQQPGQSIRVQVTTLTLTGGQLTLAGQWQLLTHPEKTQLQQKQFSFTTNAGTHPQDTTRALNQLVAELATSLATPLTEALQR